MANAFPPVQGMSATHQSVLDYKHRRLTRLRVEAHNPLNISKLRSAWFNFKNNVSNPSATEELTV